MMGMQGFDDDDQDEMTKTKMPAMWPFDQE